MNQFAVKTRSKDTRTAFAVTLLAALGTALFVAFMVISRSMSAEEESVSHFLHGAPADVTLVACDAAIAGTRHCAVEYDWLSLKTDVVVSDAAFPAATFRLEYTPPITHKTPVVDLAFEEQVRLHTTLDLTNVSREEATQWIRPLTERAAKAAEARLGAALANARHKAAVAASYQ